MNNNVQDKEQHIMANGGTSNSSTAQPQQQLQQVAAKPAKREPVSPAQSLAKLLADNKTKLASLLPKHLTPERLLRVALNSAERNPKLLECSQSSILRCVLQAAELGLEPGGALGYAYLVPYKSECTLTIGYKGMVELARRSGQIRHVRARVVFERDGWKYEERLEGQVLRHIPTEEANPGPPLRVYAIITYATGETFAEVMPWAEVQRIRMRSRAKDDGPWVTDELEMAKKTVLRRALKTAPMDPEIREKLEEVDGDTLDVQAVVHGSNELPASTAEATSTTQQRVRRLLIPPDEVVRGGPAQAELVPEREPGEEG